MSISMGIVFYIVSCILTCVVFKSDLENKPALGRKYEGEKG